MTILFLIIAMFFNIFAQYILKSAVTNLRFDSFSIQTISKFVAVPSIWFGAMIYGLSFFFYIFALSRGDLSKISPVSQALTTLGIVVMSVLVFNEALTTYKIIGLAFLLIGTIVIFIK